MGEDRSGIGETRTDRLLGGRLVLLQPAKGHRAGTDAVLLSAAADLAGGQRFVDVGAGVGTVGLAVALRHPEASGVLLERDPDLAALACRNVALNGLGERLRVVCADLFDRHRLEAEELLHGSDLVLSNPPFFLSDEVRASPEPLRARAHVAARGRGHGDWLAICAKLAGPKGRLLVIHRADALGDALRLPPGWGAPIVRPVYARNTQPAIRVLVGATRGRRTALQLLHPLVLHAADRFGAEAEALHEGGPMPFWPKRRPASREAGLQILKFEGQ